MKTLVRWAARLYPAAWRARYAPELEVLLEDVGPGGRDLWDILRGALLMHMRMTAVSFWKILAGGAIAGLLAAGAWSVTHRDRYVSTAVLRMSLAPPPSPADPQWTLMHHLLEMQQIVLSRSSLSSIIVQHNLYLNERKKLPLEDVILLMRNRDLRIQPTRAAGESTFAVEFSYEDPAAAQAAVSAVVASLVEQNLQVSLRPGNGATNIMVLDPASLPAQPTGPSRLLLVGAGLGAGLLLGLFCGAIWSVVRNQKRLTFRRIGGFALAGVTFGLTIAYLLPDEFVSIAVLRNADKSTLPTTIEHVLSDDSLAAIARQTGLFPRELGRGNMHDVTRRMRESISVTTNLSQRITGAKGAIVISFTYPDRWKAQHATRDLVARFTGIPQSPTEVLDPASLPQSPGFPNRPAIALLGTFVGIVLGVAASHLRKITPATA
jgi:hypothetical protein